MRKIALFCLVIWGAAILGGPPAEAAPKKQQTVQQPQRPQLVVRKRRQAQQQKPNTDMMWTFINMGAHQAFNRLMPVALGAYGGPLASAGLTVILQWARTYIEEGRPLKPSEVSGTFFVGLNPLPLPIPGVNEVFYELGVNMCQSMNPFCDGYKNPWVAQRSVKKRFAHGAHGAVPRQRRGNITINTPIESDFSAEEPNVRQWWPGHHFHAPVWVVQDWWPKYDRPASSTVVAERP